ncbi:MAG: translocation/assembly module TamB domain-containing protein [Candidatus Marinimicrobia bacterium]|nr:translocation/assembly module TamB domain-containing protein [Candidatus Neomarinimicrobiota bacterium]
MKKHLKLFLTSLSLVLLVGIIGLLIFIFQPNMYRNQIEATLNEEFATDKGSQFIMKGISGNLLNGFEIQKLSYSDSLESFEVYSEKLILKYSLRELLRGQFILKELKFVKPYIYFNLNKGKKYAVQDDSTLGTGREISISSLVIEDGSFEISEGNFRYLVENLNLRGSFFMDGGNMEISLKDGGFEYPSRNLVLEGLSGSAIYSDEGWRYESLQFTALDCDVIVSGWMETSPRLQMGLDMAADVNSFGDILEFLGQKIELDGKVSIVGNVGGALSDLGFNFSAYGEAGGKKFEEFNLSGGYTGEKLELVNLDGIIDGAKIEGNGHITRRGNFSGELNFENLDLSKLDVGEIRSSINGNVIFNGSGYSKETLTLHGELNISRSQVADIDIESAVASISIKDESVNIEKLSVLLKESSLDASGRLGFNQIINTDISVTSNNLNEISSLIGVNEIQGKLTANLTLSGNIADLNIAGKFNINELVGEKGNFESAEGIFVLNNLSTAREGNGFFHLENGKVQNISIASLDISTKLAGGKFFIENFKAENGGDFVKLVGWIEESGQFEVDSLSGKYQGYKISSKESIRGIMNKELLTIEPVAIELIGGSVDFSMEWNRETDNLASTLLIRTVDLQPISDIMDSEKEFGGIASGALVFSNSKENLTIKLLLKVEKAIFGDFSFEKVSVDVLHESDRLILNKLKVSESEDSWIEFSGFVDMDHNKLIWTEKAVSKDDILELTTIFNNVNLFTYREYNPFKQPIGGSVTGIIEVSNTFLEPDIVYDLEIRDGWYDLVSFKKLDGSGTYHDSRLVFKDLNATTENGEYSADGYVPINLALWKVEGRKLDRPIELNVRGLSNDLHFISPYFTDIDEIKGEFDIEFMLSGSFLSPVRDARILVKNGRVDTNLLQNSPSKIEGEFLIEKNKGRIVSLSGKMEGGKKGGLIGRLLQKTSGIFSGIGDIFKSDTEVNPNHFEVTGEINFSSFFRPILDLKFKGEQLYILSILGNLESVTDVDLTITGQDTIEITGELQPDFVTIRAEFVEELEEEVIEESIPYLVYNIHAQSPDKFYLKNSQADIEFSGDIWIIKRPQEEYNFSGNISAIKGKFYYINDTFTIERAELGFDPYEFNPTFDILATTTIGIGKDSEKITVEMGGTLEKPTYNFESESGYSESEILSLINFKQQGGAISTTGLGTGVQLMATSYLEKSLEELGGQLAGFDIFDLQTESGTFQDIQSAELLLGRQISRSFYVTYQKGLQRLASSQQIGVEYKINKISSLAGNVDTEGLLLHVSYKLRFQY